MTRSVCFSTTLFYGVEIFLSSLALFVIFYEDSNHCLTIHHDLSLHSCHHNQSLIKGAHDLFIAQEDHVMKDILEKRLTGLKSISCRSLERTQTILFLAYFLAINILICIAVYFRRRMIRIRASFHNIEPIVLSIATALPLVAVLYLQEEEHKSLMTLPDEVSGLNLEAPINWLKANGLAIVLFLWKTFQALFHMFFGDKKIVVDHPVFKIFDFSKNYGQVPSEETHN